MIWLCAAVAGAADWPRFRGPNGSGVGEGAGYPASLERGTEVWRTPVPAGQSSPVIAAGRLYLTASDGDRLLTLAFDPANGKELWRAELVRTRKQKGYAVNGSASPTPVADELGVYAFFEDFGLIAYDRDGKERWRAPLGPFKNFYGMASSPILVGEALVQLCDQQTGSYLLALDRETGRVKWKRERPGAPIGWATPMVFQPTGGPAQMIVIGSNRLDGYYAETGEPIWWMPVGSGGALGTPSGTADMVLLSTAGSSEPLLSTFESALEEYDANKDENLSREELAKVWLGEHFGWLDADESGLVSAAEWNYAKSMEAAEYGAIALRAGELHGEAGPEAAVWRYQKSLPYVPAPL
ncbi:MAG: PQQ-binding-like beta-propeller repeat protein, partial [Acidobacteria bacterium]|nr:PQQ-binding-like beta-propeller repeat protein [Acidobacteriota bacterium]